MKYLTIAEVQQRIARREASQLRVLAILNNYKPCDHLRTVTVAEHFEELEDGTTIEVAEQTRCRDCGSYLL